MSLINDVLRDLEKRERTAPAAVQAALGPAPATASPSPLLWRVLSSLLLLIGALSIWWLWPAPVQPAPVIDEQLEITTPVVEVLPPRSAEPTERLAELQPVELQPVELQAELQQVEPEVHRQQPQDSGEAAQPQSKTLQPHVVRTATPTRPAAVPHTAGTVPDSHSSGIHIRRRNTPPEVSAAPPVTPLASLETVRHNLLLAASLRETARHTEAVELYQQLTQQHPDLTQARLGLALSLEAAGQGQAASDHYQLLLDSSDPRIAQLASQRLRVLQQQATEDSPPPTRERTSHP